MFHHFGKLFHPQDHHLKIPVIREHFCFQPSFCTGRIRKGPAEPVQTVLVAAGGLKLHLKRGVESLGQKKQSYSMFEGEMRLESRRIRTKC